MSDIQRFSFFSEEYGGRDEFVLAGEYDHVAKHLAEVEQERDIHFHSAEKFFHEADTLKGENNRLTQQLAELETAIDTTDYRLIMDPPDGGAPSYVEKVRNLIGRLAEVEQERDTQRRLVDQLNRELTQRKVTLGDLVQFDVQQRKEIAELKQKLDDCQESDDSKWKAIAQRYDFLYPHTPDRSTVTPERIERYIHMADDELGPECSDDYVAELRAYLRAYTPNWRKGA